MSEMAHSNIWSLERQQTSLSITFNFGDVTQITFPVILAIPPKFVAVNFCPSKTTALNEIVITKSFNVFC